MARLALLFSIHRIFVRAFLIVSAPLVEDKLSGPQSAAQREAEDLRAPVNEEEARRRIARGRALRARKFIMEIDSHFSIFIWMAVAAPVLHMHYSLFKTGRGLGMDGNDLALADMILKRGTSEVTLPAKIIHEFVGALSWGSESWSSTWFFLKNAFGSDAAAWPHYLFFLTF